MRGGQGAVPDCPLSAASDVLSLAIIVVWCQVDANRLSPRLGFSSQKGHFHAAAFSGARTSGEGIHPKYYCDRAVNRLTEFSLLHLTSPLIPPGLGNALERLLLGNKLSSILDSQFGAAGRVCDRQQFAALSPLARD